MLLILETIKEHFFKILAFLLSLFVIFDKGKEYRRKAEEKEEAHKTRKEDIKQSKESHDKVKEDIKDTSEYDEDIEDKKEKRESLAKEVQKIKDEREDLKDKDIEGEIDDAEEANDYLRDVIDNSNDK